jgi:tRNA(fMet)-specific endonuclease VapC
LILDTNAVSALLTGEAALGRLLSPSERPHLPLGVIAEYQYGLQGVTSVRRRRRLESLFNRLDADSITLYPDRETANWYVAIRHQLRRRGRPIPESDLWIAALARQYQLDILSQDPHFDAVEKVRRISW